MARPVVGGTALLAIEALSDESASRDLMEKRREHERAGIEAYRLIDARLAQSEFVYLRLTDNGRDQPVEPDAQGHDHATTPPCLWFDPLWRRGVDKIPGWRTTLWKAGLSDAAG